MPGITSVLDIGRLALSASQVAIQVTGDNISNVNTEGYARRELQLAENFSIDAPAGQLGTGVVATQVLRHFDQWIENAYNDKATMQSRWDTVYSNLQNVESMFNESAGFGVSSSLSTFLSDWQTLAGNPSDLATRSSLVGDAKTMVSVLHQADNDLASAQAQVDTNVTQDVQTVNTLLGNITDLNKQINAQEIPGKNNANELRDERATKVRELGTYIDLKYIDNGGGNVTILTQAGQTLVDGIVHYDISYDAPQATSSPTVNSPFDGQVYFEGEDSSEYTLKVVSNAGGGVSSGAGAAQFQVSLDGGLTWLKDNNGNVKTFAARPEDGKVTVGNLKIWFGSASDPATPPATAFGVGDTFTIVPKRGLYWNQNTSTKENLTPQSSVSGADNSRRLTGGKLAGELSFRDEMVGKYRTQLNALAKSVAWEVNRQHSQGAGLQSYSLLEASNAVDGSGLALGSDASGLAYSSLLTSGSATMYIYDSYTGQIVSGAALDFSSAPGQQNFDPSKHSLNDVRDAFNRTFAGSLTATIVNNKLQLQAADGKTFQFGTDSTGLMAGLGLNTFFQGSSASTLDLADPVRSSTDHICAGHVNGGDEVNVGDNTTATAIASLQDTKVRISSTFGGTTDQTLLTYYDTLVSRIGADTQSSSFNAKYQKALADDLNNRQQAVSGVNLDEEMANLIKYQHSYTAAAKLITTADQMLQTVLGMKT